MLVHLLHEDDKKYIEVMAAYSNFSDFYNRVQYLQKVEQDIGTNARALRLAKEDLEAKKVTLESRDAGNLGQLSAEEILNKLSKEIKEKK